MDWIEKYKVHELTPIEEHNGMLFKRDDLYMPFDDIPLSGGKVRQAICLISNNLDKIRNECENHIITSTNIDSPQGLIVTRVSQDYGLKSTVFLGSTTLDSVLKKSIMHNAYNFGADFQFAKAAYESVITNEIKKKKLNGEKFFHIKFGINIDEDKESILGANSYQVQNLPNDLDYLVVPSGSAISFCGIMLGLMKYGIHPKNIVTVQISGKDLFTFVENTLEFEHLPYKMYISKDYPYHKKVNVKIADNFTLDPIYEAKAYDYMMKYLGNDIKDKKVCFWCVGNTIPVREKIYGDTK